MRNWRDLQSLAYLIALPTLVYWQWQFGFSWILFFIELFLTLGVGVIHHNHTHLRIWHNKILNRLTDFWLTLLQGHPTFVFHISHIANHHRYNHTEMDMTRTYRFEGFGGERDTNNLFGYVLHPFQAIGVLYPHFFDYLKQTYGYHRRYFYYCLLQYVIVIGSWLALALIDWKKCLLLVIVPQLHGLHWLLATNYLQHAHADGRSQPKKNRQARQLKNFAYARNFYGLLNPFLFNIGYHTAHHEHSRAHWSTLPRLHQDYAPQIPQELQEPSLLRYMFRVYLLGFFNARWRTQSLHERN